MEINELKQRILDYSDLSNMLKTSSYGEIINTVASGVGMPNAELEQMPLEICSNGQVPTYGFAVTDLLKNVGQYDYLYSRLADDESKRVLTLLNAYRIFPAENLLQSASEAKAPESFDNNISNSAQIIEGVTLDENMDEVLGFVKIGAKDVSKALLGAKKHIARDLPKIEMGCHTLTDIWVVPRLIEAIAPGYSFYIRHYDEGEKRNTVLYAKPPQRNVPKQGAKSKKILVLSQEGAWKDAFLTKDCGLVPYLLHKNHGHEVSMLCSKTQEYPSLNTYVKGLKAEYLENGNPAEMIKYTSKHAREYDALILHGPYEAFYPVVKAYKQLNPNGVIYLALDANSAWMDRTKWDEPEFMEFMDACDVIGASSRDLAEYLNDKWRWCINYLPNGYYNLLQTPQSAPDFDKKENTIITVARLGIPEKCNDILLEAFAKIADKIPDWKLKLIGNVDPSFEEFKHNFYEQHPDLKERVIFTGAIYDKKALYDEYAKAKIFALTSDCEGGAPNVIGEAFANGLACATTRIDAYRDITGDNEEIGLCCEINDAGAFAEILYKLCNDENLRQKSEKAYARSQNEYDMERVAARINEMMFGER